MTPVERKPDRPTPGKTETPHALSHAAMRDAMNNIQALAITYDGLNAEIIAHDLRCRDMNCTADARRERAKISLQLVAAARDLVSAAGMLAVVHAEPARSGATN